MVYVLASWLIALSLLGAVDSFYTALQQRFPALFEYCFDWKFRRVRCYEILHSEWARIFRVVPNSWIGVVSYLLLAAIYYYARMSDVLAADRLYAFGALVATAGFLVSWFLLYVQAFVLKKFCIFCLMSTTLMTIIAALAWIAYL